MKKVPLVNYVLLILFFAAAIILAWYWFSYKLAVILILFSAAIVISFPVLKKAGALPNSAYQELAEQYQQIIYKLCKDNPAFDEFTK